MRVVEAPTARETHGRRSQAFAPGHATLPRVALRSWELVTPLGDGVDSVWQSLLRGDFATDHAKCAGSPGALELAQQVVARLTTRVSVYPDAAVIVGTSKGSVGNWLDPRGVMTQLRWGLGDIAAAVADDLGICGPRLTVSAACASGLHALIRAAMMIQSGEVRQALVVATEASVHPLFLGSFHRLGVLARAGTGCRPFDRNREGFVMSEASAAVLLEAEDSPQSPRPAGRASCPPAPVYLDRFALGADGTHLTGGDPEARVLRNLLSRVIDNRPVDLFHAHGTGTVTNDPTELAAIESVLASQPAPPALYSHKGALGHSLGAAGLLSAVLNCQAHVTGVIPPNVQTHDPLPTTRSVISREAIRRPVRRSVAVAAGFGGAMAALSLRTAD